MAGAKLCIAQGRYSNIVYFRIRKMTVDPQGTEAPETVHREQQDEASQAQTFAAEARMSRALANSRKPAGAGPADDAQDLVDHMRQMTRSGRIDMDAYRGERSDDDEGSMLGPAGEEDEGPRGSA